ncbi:hypothetical protein M5K25_020366 [Dendrobium thyrsiflorum]|uniref:Uncharacterized protein n=1 Tax=Dendrobium thyrsiflorum TaxID=117978 RepID=A0ABD0UGR2_DENTH
MVAPAAISVRNVVLSLTAIFQVSLAPDVLVAVSGTVARVVKSSDSAAAIKLAAAANVFADQLFVLLS